MNPPPWVRRVCTIAVLAGLALVVLGPVAAYAAAKLTMDPAAPPEEAFAAALQPWKTALMWTTPIGMAALFQGGIGLLFLWVTRVAQPPAAAPPADPPTSDQQEDAPAG